MSEERKKVWIHAFQTKMLIRIGAYWLIYLVTLWNLLFVWRLIQEGPAISWISTCRFLQDYYPPLILFVALLPVAAWDAVKFAHRLVGPIGGAFVAVSKTWRPAKRFIRSSSATAIICLNFETISTRCWNRSSAAAYRC